MTALTRQQLCAELAISESTVRRLELTGLPFTQDGRRKLYDLAKVKGWLEARRPVVPPPPSPEMFEAMRRLGESVEQALRKGPPC